MLAEYKSSVVSRLGTRRSMAILLASATVLFLLLAYFSLYVPNGLASEVVRKASPFHSPFGQAVMVDAKTRLAAAASNRTLGLDSIQFLNLPHRHDRFDAMAIQAYLSDIDITRFPAVVADELRDQGMPPTEHPTRLNWREKGCWRAHANVWQMMLQKRVPAVLILESDASWDVNLRDVMGRLVGPFRELLREENPSFKLADEPDDPWAARTGLWDVLTVGHCFDNYQRGAAHRVYDDPHASADEYVFDETVEPLRAQRAVFHSAGMVCTTGYLVSLRGAAKMLTRMAWNLEEPIDLVMNIMAGNGELTVYSVRKRIISQWAYVPGIGMAQRGANSDINNGSVDDQAEDGWPEAKRTMSVWGYRDLFSDTNFPEMALQVAWKTIMAKPVVSSSDGRLGST